MTIVEKEISLEELSQMAGNMFEDLVKAVVDVEKGMMAVDAGMHADEEQMLLENGSKQQNLWGINLRPKFYGTDDFIEFDSMINLRPGQNNRSRSIDDSKIREKIVQIVNKLVIK